MLVLVCLESANATTAVAEYFGVHGIDVERADDCDLARRLLRFRSYDGLLCDTEGPTLAKLAKARHAGTRTVVLSTESPEKSERDTSVVDSLLVKPLPLSAILGCLGGTA